MWLKKASQCPTCRVPITEENPCREIIGGTNESDHKEKPSTRKCLRKTRVELIFREYEDEIDSLVRENEELKNKSEHLESQLKTALDPGAFNTMTTDDKRVDPFILEELTHKLRVATDACEKVKQDMDRLKEANKTLRSQNIDLVQENMRLKAEVASRSPQKFGRFTVAALEAKVQQYERNTDQLKRALERSDQYIEELESRIKKSETKCGDLQEQVQPEEFTQQQKINMMMRSLSDNERQSICSNPEAECRMLSQNHNLMFLPSGNRTEFNKSLTGKQKCEDLNGTSADFMPTTPSSAFRSLTLKSPGIREKKVAFKPTSYLRKLDFDDIPSSSESSTVENQFMSLNKLPPNTDMETKSVFWGSWHNPKSVDSCSGPSQDSPPKGAASSRVKFNNCDRFQMASEASMDAAYLDKISELDSMMLDGESLSSRGSQLSLAASPTKDLDNTLISETQLTSTFAPVHRAKGAMDRSQQAQPLCPTIDLKDKEDPTEVLLPVPTREAGAGVQEETSQNDELSFELLFDSLDESKDGASAERDPNKASSSSSFCSDKPEIIRDRNTISMPQPTKRKSYSPFSTSSPTKLSKLM